MIYLFIFLSLIVTIIFYRETNPEISVNKRYLLAFLRFISLTILITLLFNPIIRLKQNQNFVRKTIILNDISKSMSLNFAGKSKHQYFKQILERLSKNKNVIKIDFADGINGNITSTDIIKTLKQLKSKISFNTINNVLLLSDGWFKNSNLDYLKNIPFPIYTVYPTVKDKRANLSVSEIKSNNENYTNEETPIIAVLESDNYNKKAKVNFYLNNKKLKSKIISFATKNKQSVTFFHEFRNQGLYNIKIEIIPSEKIDETYKDDNYQITALNVLKSKIKILLISDKLTWDTKFITRALRLNKHLEIINITYQRDFFIGKKNVRLSDLIKNCSNIFIVNNGKLRFNLKQKKILDSFVKESGGLVFIGKPNLDILPVTDKYFKSEEKNSILFTEESKEYASFDIDETNIPPLDYYYVNSKIGAKILAVFTNLEKSPAMIYKKNGKGKILYFSFLNFWRWQMWDENDKYSHFIMNITRWLHTNTIKKFKLSLNKTGFYPNENIKIKIFAYDEKLSKIKNLNLKMEILDSKLNSIKTSYLIEGENSYNYTTSLNKPGKYKIKILRKNKTIAESNFLIFDTIPENFDKGFNIINLKYVASLTSGKSFSIRETDDLLKDINSKQNRIKLIKFKEIPLYKKIYFILIFILSFIIELYLRKRWGLL